MSFIAWYRRQPERLEWERDEYLAEGLDFSLREDLLDRHGVVIFEGMVDIDGQSQTLMVLYPPGFPSFRPDVIAKGVSLARHQNPYDRNLCVIPHEEWAWRSDYPGAFMVNQAVELLETSRQGPGAVMGREVDAPEPQSGWYPYTQDASLVILQDLPTFPPGEFGTFECVLRNPYGAGRGLQAFLTEITFQSGSPRWRLANPPRPLACEAKRSGTWISVGEPPPPPKKANGERGGYEEVVAWAKKQDASLGYRLERQRKQGDRAEFLGIAYPDETLQRGEFHPTWLVAFRPPKHPPILFRPIHYTPGIRLQRLPGLAGLPERRALVVGLGVLGRTVALGLARAGVGHLGIVDPDFVDAGPLVRQEYDLRDVGLAKVTAVEMAIGCVNPWTTVEPFDVRLGATSDLLDMDHLPERDPLETFAEQISNYDLLISTTGTAADRIINQVGAAMGIPRIFTWVLNGTWGGRIFRALPRQACFDCLAYCWDEYPRPAEDPEGTPIYARGCGFPTFTGTGFDSATVAQHTVRVAAQTLLKGQPGAYPDGEFNLINCSNRGPADGFPTTERFFIPRQEQCPTCRQYPS